MNRIPKTLAKWRPGHSYEHFQICLDATWHRAAGKFDLQDVNTLLLAATNKDRRIAIDAMTYLVAMTSMDENVASYLMRLETALAAQVLELAAKV